MRTQKISILLVLIIYSLTQLISFGQNNNKSGAAKADAKILYLIDNEISSYQEFMKIDPNNVKSLLVIEDSTRIAQYSIDKYDKCLIYYMKPKKVLQWKAYSSIDDSIMNISTLLTMTNKKERKTLIASYIDKTFSLSATRDSTMSLLLMYPEHSNLFLLNIPLSSDTSYIGEIELIPNKYFTRNEYDSIMINKVIDFRTQGFSKRKSKKITDDFMMKNYHMFGNISEIGVFVSNNEIRKNRMNYINDKSSTVEIDYMSTINTIIVDYNTLVKK